MVIQAENRKEREDNTQDEVKKRDVFLLPSEREEDRRPKIHLGDFSGPLDLLVYLIEKNEIDLFDIPLADLTEQYMSYLDDLDTLDMELASDFLLMGASLIELKSKMILPQDENAISEDPRDELVLRLLAYRRCKLIAQDLKKRVEIFSSVYYRLPETADSLGIHQIDPSVYFADESEFRVEKFQRARQKVYDRNHARFQDLHEKMNYIVSREAFNLKTWIQKVWHSLKSKVRLSFNALFPKNKGRSERLTGFLAVLELLKQNSIRAKQDGPFEDIIITRREEDEEGNHTSH